MNRTQITAVLLICQSIMYATDKTLVLFWFLNLAAFTYCAWSDKDASE